MFTELGQEQEFKVMGFQRHGSLGRRQTKTRDCFHIACDESEFEKRTEARGMGQHNKQARKSS